LPETPQHLEKSNPEELEAFEIEPGALKQMRNVCDPITASFEDFDLAISTALQDHKTLGLFRQFPEKHNGQNHD